MDSAFLAQMHSHSMVKLTSYLFDEKYDFLKILGVSTYFSFIFKGKKIRKKTLSVTPKGKNRSVKN